MRILYAVSILPPTPGGAAIDFECIIRNLARLHPEDEITVLTERGAANTYPGNVRLVGGLLPNHSLPGRLSRVRQVANYLLLWSHLLRRSYEVIHIHSQPVGNRHLGLATSALLRCLGARVFIDVRDKFYHGPVLGHHYLVCSEELLGFYSSFRHRTYIPVPMEYPEIEPSAPSRALKRFAYIGTIVENKGIPELVEAFRRLLAKRPDAACELILYGNNKIGLAFEASIADCPNIRWMGPIAHAQVYRAILEADAVFLPSCYEGQPRICIEVMYCGRPVFCYRGILPITPWLPREYVLENTTPEAILAKYEMLLSGSAPEPRYAYPFSDHEAVRIAERLYSLYSGRDSIPQGPSPRPGPQ